MESSLFQLDSPIRHLQMFVAACLLAAGLDSLPARAQPSAAPGEQVKPSADQTAASEKTATAHAAAHDFAGDISRTIDDLSHPSYRARQLARWRLEQVPAETIEVVDQRLGEVSYQIGAQLVDVLSSLATHADLEVSVRARETLQKHANRVSAVGRMADNAVRAIADVQEEQALQVLTHHGARFGPANSLGIVLNGQMPRDDDNFALWIDESFTGNDEVVAWIQFLKSVDIVYLQGPKIGPAYFRAVAKLKDIKRLKCKNVALSVNDLQQLKSFAWLKLLELAYVNVDDSYVKVLAELPISETLRLFGTQITPEGARLLAENLDGIEIYCGKGGHLGIATHPSNTFVTEVKPNTGAQRAGILDGDQLTHVNGVKITNMSELRAELAKHSAGETVHITLVRQPLPNEYEEMTLPVTLTEDPN